MKLRLPGRDKVSDLLAWLAFLMAVAGGFAATGSWLGTLVGKIVNIGPWWLPLALGVGGLAYILFDLFEDGVPDRLRTIYIMILWPSTWASIEGKLGNFLAGWIHDGNTYMDKQLGPWVADHPQGKNTIMTGIAVAAITFALIWGHRYASAKKAARNTAGTATATPTPAARRGAR